MRGQRSLNTRVRLWHRLLSQVNRVTSLDTQCGCGCALHFKSREQQVMQDALRVPGVGEWGWKVPAVRWTQGALLGPSQWTAPAAQQLLECLLLLLLILPSRAGEQERQQGNSMKAQLNNTNFNPGTSTIAQGLELLPNLLRVHSFPSGSSSLLSANFTISFSWITLSSPSSPGKFPKTKQLNSV